MLYFLFNEYILPWFVTHWLVEIMSNNSKLIASLIQKIKCQILQKIKNMGSY